MGRVDADLALPAALAALPLDEAVVGMFASWEMIVMPKGVSPLPVTAVPPPVGAAPMARLLPPVLLLLGLHAAPNMMR